MTRGVTVIFGTTALSSTTLFALSLSLDLGSGLLAASALGACVSWIILFGVYVQLAISLKT